MKILDEIINMIEGAIIEDAPNVMNQDIIIKENYDEGIDQYRHIIQDSHNWLSHYQEKISKETGIPNIKIKYNSNAGYFIEVSQAQIHKVPENFIFKQSLKQVSRYVTLELQDFAEKINTAYDGIYQAQSIIFNDICNNVILQFNNLSNISNLIAQLDFYSNAAYVSGKNGYIRPEIHEKYSLDIAGGQHPVLSLIQHGFVSNDLHMSYNDKVHVITGPNMGGKSTFLRQNALLILMSQIGFNIPAVSANIGVVDNIFSRVGAGDNLFLGQSTFMVEMQEISYILRHASKNSFIIIDEIGRGTSTYDGMSLAWAILEKIYKEISAKTLFATHYHEIIDHVEQFTGVSNYSVAVGENEKNIVFLRKIIPGGIKKSYGLHVAQISGVPEDIITSAQQFMNHMSQSSLFSEFHDTSIVGASEVQDSKEQEILNIIRDIDVNNLSPLHAFEKILYFKQQLKNTK